MPIFSAKSPMKTHCGSAGGSFANFPICLTGWYLKIAHPWASFAFVFLTCSGATWKRRLHSSALCLRPCQTGPRLLLQKVRTLLHPVLFRPPRRIFQPYQTKNSFIAISQDTHRGFPQSESPMINVETSKKIVILSIFATCKKSLFFFFSATQNIVWLETPSPSRQSHFRTSRECAILRPSCSFSLSLPLSGVSLGPAPTKQPCEARRWQLWWEIFFGWWRKKWREKASQFANSRHERDGERFEKDTKSRAVLLTASLLASQTQIANKKSSARQNHCVVGHLYIYLPLSFPLDLRGCCDRSLGLFEIPYCTWDAHVVTYKTIASLTCTYVGKLQMRRRPCFGTEAPRRCCWVSFFRIWVLLWFYTPQNGLPAELQNWATDFVVYSCFSL